MDSTVSVSKGCFVFKNGFKKKQSKGKAPESLFNSQFKTEAWYETYKQMWSNIETKIKELNTTTYNCLLKELVTYVKNCYNDDYSLFCDEVIPCATLLTGVNQPDHTSQFESLKQQLIDEVTPHVAILNSEDSSNIKHTIENMVAQFVNKEANEYDMDTTDDVKIKKNQCTMSVLKAWYEQSHRKEAFSSPSKRVKSRNSTNQLVVIIPEFENFNADTLRDLILILSGYVSSLHFVVIFGVATSVSTLHKYFPYHVSSKLYMQVFQSHSSTDFLNKILENIFFSADCPFHLGSKSFKFLIDIFLFYDFSLTGFIQGIKFCMMDHYYCSKVKTLCCPRRMIESTLSTFDDNDLESVRHLPSFRPYVESQPASTKISLLLDDDFFRTDLYKVLNNFHDYLHNFHVVLRVLNIFVCGLPNSPLGKQLRESYVYAISTNIIETPEYKQSIKLLEFQSKDDIVQMIEKCVNLIDASLPRKSKKPEKIKKRGKALLPLREKLGEHLKIIKNSGWNIVQGDADCSLDNIENLDRKQLKEKFLKASQSQKSLTEFDVARKRFLEYLTTDVFAVFLKPANTQTYHEIFVFHDAHKVKKNIIGTPRAAIHTALTNPATYLQCKCCNLAREEMILPTLPDLSIVYKLYLECGKLINLYDWLQAFVTVVEPCDMLDEEEDERRDIKPEIQARFTQAVSELQFLGFIKTSKRKTDHVTRLTW